MEKPEVSVVMPVYNGKEFLLEAIESIQAQTFKNWELIVVDDGSTDGTGELVSDVQKSDWRIRYHRFDDNYGRPARARTKGLELARGRFIAFLDADDLWLPQKLERQLAFMKSTGAPVSFHQYRRFCHEARQPGRIIDIPDVLDYEELLKQNVIGCLTAMVDRSQTGPIETWLGQRDDFVMWLKLLKRGFKGCGLKEDLARYRVGRSRMSSNKLKAAVRTWSVYREAESLSLPYALYNFTHFAIRSVMKHWIQR